VPASFLCSLYELKDLSVKYLLNGQPSMELLVAREKFLLISWYVAVETVETPCLFILYVQCF